MDKGIDYGLGKTNIDPLTGIRYGIIPMNDLNEWAWESFEPVYGPESCPECSSDLVDGEDRDYYCLECKKAYWSDELFSDPLGWSLDDGEYKAEYDEHGDIFLLESPYFTYAAFCSPCAPGAGHLRSITPNGVRTYCFGNDWFDGEKAPYHVYSVKTGELVNG